MAGLNQTDHFTVQGWMVQELGLTGGLLTTYALVHQFTQTRAGIYTGGPQYVAAWIGCTVRTAREYLHKLVEMGLTEMVDQSISGVLFRNYRVLYTPLQKFPTPGKNFPTPRKNFPPEDINKEPTDVGLYTVSPPSPRKSFDFGAALRQEGVEEQLVADWLAVRKKKRAENTKTSLDGLRREAQKAGLSVADAVRYACEQSWAGFRADWYEERKDRGTAAQQRPAQGKAGYMDRAREAARELGILEDEADEQ